MQKRHLRLRDQAGDTIVEVLIVILVMAIVIAGGYKVAIASLQTTQNTQEHGYALKIAEGQLEYLKAAAISNPDVLKQTGAFCLNSNLQVKTLPAGTPAGGMNANFINFDDFKNGSYTGCIKDSQNQDTAVCTGYCYFYSIQSNAISHNYLILVRWDGARGFRQQVQLSYRIYHD